MAGNFGDTGRRRAPALAIRAAARHVREVHAAVETQRSEQIDLTMDAGEKAERWAQAVAATILLVLLVAVLVRYVATQRPVAPPPRLAEPAMLAVMAPAPAAPAPAERERQEEIWKSGVREGAKVWEYDVALDPDALELLAAERFPQDLAGRASWMDGVVWGYLTGGGNAE
ncbi:MAG TPA: hypothetical protein VHF69_13785 [Candidatus Synoicihabitans sp.]|nr:hypothetical protein [Candidatus Synoicihabitans sp.]